MADGDDGRNAVPAEVHRRGGWRDARGNRRVGRHDAHPLSDVSARAAEPTLNRRETVRREQPRVHGGRREGNRDTSRDVLRSEVGHRLPGCGHAGEGALHGQLARQVVAGGLGVGSPHGRLPTGRPSRTRHLGQDLRVERAELPPGGEENGADVGVDAVHHGRVIGETNLPRDSLRIGARPHLA